MNEDGMNYNEDMAHMRKWLEKQPDIPSVILGNLLRTMI